MKQTNKNNNKKKDVILKMLAEGKGVTEIAQTLQVRPQVVYNYKKRYGNQLSKDSSIDTK